MFICFVEYHIAPEFEQTYRSWIAEKPGAGDAFNLYEGTDQPLLFVEVWEAESEQEALDIKKERCSERSSWHEMAQWVPGGSTKLHSWTFKPISVRS
ncbi:hypothetical protein [Paenibacillus montanisoli]|uniref:ABM domain-containing protein n=1 Tax=Paenibacillus montanisoli TaxID=2081970 RepID=A0A328TY33_9BACL|nr:hypothetical protein [Paenibacillus montanisoli]RAP75359.1 hypothetical protein DL346_18540 [Paenibacillus montanisoli]